MPRIWSRDLKGVSVFLASTWNWTDEKFRNREFLSRGGCKCTLLVVFTVQSLGVKSNVGFKAPRTSYGWKKRVKLTSNLNETWYRKLCLKFILLQGSAKVSNSCSKCLSRILKVFLQNSLHFFPAKRKYIFECHRRRNETILESYKISMAHFRVGMFALKILRSTLKILDNIYNCTDSTNEVEKFQLFCQIRTCNRSL